MVMPKIAEQIHWSEASAKQASGLWGCWECGFEDSYVRDVDKDTDHVRVRYRQCTRCGSMWETEERRLSRGSFFSRAERRRYAAFRKTRYRVRSCLMCHEKYLQGTYVAHSQASTAHQAALARRAERKRKRERDYARRWMAAKRAVGRQNREQAA